jgi:hypothetical protein
MLPNVVQHPPSNTFSILVLLPDHLANVLEITAMETIAEEGNL